MADKKPGLGTLVNLKMDLTTDDVVAIKISDIENKLTAFENATLLKIESAESEQRKILAEIDLITKDAMNEEFKEKAQRLATALEEFEGWEKGRVNIKIGIGNSIQIKEKMGVSIQLHAKRHERTSYDDSLYSSQLTMDRPAAYFELVKKLDAVASKINTLTGEIQKARNALSKMPSVERHVRAHIARTQLAADGQHEILKALDNVPLPGLAMPLLEAPVKD